MEPPSSVNSDQNKATGVTADDPLSRFLAAGTYIVVTGFPDDEEKESGFVVCGYSPFSGLTYLGTMGGIYS